MAGEQEGITFSGGGEVASDVLLVVELPVSWDGGAVITIPSSVLALSVVFWSFEACSTGLGSVVVGGISSQWL